MKKKKDEKEKEGSEGREERGERGEKGEKGAGADVTNLKLYCNGLDLVYKMERENIQKYFKTGNQDEANV